MEQLNKPLADDLQYVVTLAPLIKSLFSNDVGITITDTEQFVFSMPSGDLPKNPAPFRMIEPRDPVVTVMKNNRPQSFSLPKEMYGVDMFIATIPIPNRHRQVIGSLTISASVKNKMELAAIAEQFAVSSEQIGASTLNLTSTAGDLSSNMEIIAEAQNNLTVQVNDSTKILEMINTVAKSTRILGFNAGIEAARSGEHGKGFAVVAKEITKLADQSSDAVNEIHKLLDSMKQKVADITTSVTSTIDVANVQTSALHEITDSIKQLTRVAEQIDTLAQKL